MATKKAKAVAVPEVIVGSNVRFLGYDATTPEEERILEEGAIYPVVEVSDEGYVLKCNNPDFDAKKKVNATSNPETIEADVFPEEVELAGDDEMEEAAQAGEEVAEAEEAKPAKAAAKTSRVVEKVAPAPVATKVKAGKKPVEKVVPAVKEKAVKAAKVPAVKEEDTSDELPDLENEDEGVLALVEGSEDLVVTAQELEADIGTAEYQIGGILYHIKKSGSFKSLKPEYADNKGFALFLSENLNIEYRKAMYLIKIYIKFTQAGIENPAERVATIGWTKASKIADLMTEDGQEPEELLELAESSTVAELSDAISAQNVNVGEAKGTPVKRVTMKFRYFEEEGTVLTNIIKDVQISQALKSEEEALAFILNDWASANLGGVADEESAPVQTAPVGRVAKAAASKPAVGKARAKA